MDVSKETFGYKCGSCIHCSNNQGEGRYSWAYCKAKRSQEPGSNYDDHCPVDIHNVWVPFCEDFRHVIISEREGYDNQGKEYKLKFGKYKGIPVYDVLKTDINYAKWLFKDTQNAVIWTILKHYSEELGIDLETGK